MIRTTIYCLAALITSGLCSCGNDTQQMQTAIKQTDSIPNHTPVVYDSIQIFNEIANWPFPDGPVNADYFREKMGDKVKIAVKLEPSSYDENVTDTLRTITWDASSAKTLRNALMKGEMLLYADITDPSFVFKKNLRMGMSQDEVFRIFGQSYDPGKTYKYLQITYGDGAQNDLYIFFTNKTVSGITFWPYTG